MNLRLGIADYTFPKLEWEQSLRLARDLGFEAVDLGLFAGRSHLRPEEMLAHPAQAAARIVTVLREHALEIADIFGQPGGAFEERAVNHPDPLEREKAAQFFWRFLELAARSNARHVTLLPGVHFKSESYDDSLKRSVEELAWRREAAAKIGIVLAVEPHIGSIIEAPSLALRLLGSTTNLTLTLDYGHFTCQGIPDGEIEPLLARASHFHARAACKGKLQAAFEENTIDYRRILATMKQTGYAGYITLEYVWTDWMQCNRVDNLSETILLRDRLRTTTF
jgi:sugar phosphate isomerase/epimerase